MKIKAIDLKKTLAPYKSGWVAINGKNKKVVAHAKNFGDLSKKIKDQKDIFLMPASQNYFGFVTLFNA
ncbi:MAG: DUF5678 domain-containing protein [Patescibacteria group bacterium]|nr:DUF5678 domain-containing protein [Patescibacteria group bacterium]